MYKRIFTIVLDGTGIGECEDQYLYGDEGSNTIRSLTKSNELHVPNLRKMGLFNIDDIGFETKYENPIASYGKCTESSKGKDTITGHFEMMGIITSKPAPTYPNGFPDEIITEFEKQTGRKVIVNKPYSGTEVIKDYGEEHIKTGNLIVYTSADSVFQIAAHEDIVPVEELYRYCEIARKMLVGEHQVGRVIARPFTGTHPFIRTEARKDYPIFPKKNTMNFLQENGYDVIGVGKINEIFLKSGITKEVESHNNEEGMTRTKELLNYDFNGLCYVNLEDFDMLYGHRNNVDGFAKALSEFDSWLGNFISNMKEDDLLIITADHGCDPGTESTDHSREYVPLIVYNNKNSINLGIRKTYADIGKTILDNFNIENNLPGQSFYNDIK